MAVFGIFIPPDVAVKSRFEKTLDRFLTILIMTVVRQSRLQVSRQTNTTETPIDPRNRNHKLQVWKSPMRNVSIGFRVSVGLDNLQSM